MSWLLVHVISSVKWNKILNEKVWILAKIDLSARVADSFLVIGLIFATRIMCWVVTICGSIKVIIIWGSNEGRSIRVPINLIWCHTITSCCYVFYIPTTHWSIFLCDQTSTIWLTNNPIIHVWLDHQLFPNVLPKIPVYSPKRWLIEWRSGWDWDIGATGRPVWTGGYGIASWSEIVVICKGVAVNQGPASPVSFHVTVNLK